MRKSFMLIVWIWLLLTQIYCYEIIVGNGNEIDQHLPCDPFCSHSGSQLIYESNYFPYCGMITQISFQYHFMTANPQNYLNNITVMMGESSLNSFQNSESFVNLAELEVCFEGYLTEDNFQEVSNTGDGWMIITLDQPYNYTQSGNLVFFFLENESENGINGDNFISFSTSQNTSMCIVDQDDPIDLNNLVEPVLIRNHLPNTIFELTVDENYPQAIFPHNNAEDVGVTTPLQFNVLEPANAEITVYSGFNEFNIPFPANLQPISGDVYEIYPELPFAPNSYYEWQVSYTNAGTIYYSETLSFTTNDQVQELNLTNTGTNNDVVNLLWNSLYANQYPYYVYKDAELISTQNTNTLIDTQCSLNETYDYQVKFFYLDNSVVESGICSVELESIENDIINEQFEDYPSFQTNLGSWQNIDNDGSTTYSLPGYEYLNQEAETGFVVFEPGATIPPLNINITGEKCLVSFSSSIPPTSDILISPSFQAYQVEVDIYLKSYDISWGMERVKCGVIYNNNQENMHYFEDGNYLDIPGEMTHFNFVHDTENEEEIITNFWLESCGVQTMMLVIDRIVISSTDTSNDDSLVESVSETMIYPNPVTKGSFDLVNNRGLSEVSVYNLKGQLVHRTKTDSKNQKIYLPNRITSGIYLVKVKSSYGEIVKKISVLK